MLETLPTEEKIESERLKAKAGPLLTFVTVENVAAAVSTCTRAWHRLAARRSTHAYESSVSAICVRV